MRDGGVIMRLDSCLLGHAPIKVCVREKSQGLNTRGIQPQRLAVPLERRCAIARGLRQPGNAQPGARVVGEGLSGGSVNA